jgi:hypothetical protein
MTSQDCVVVYLRAMVNTGDNTGIAKYHSSSTANLETPPQSLNALLANLAKRSDGVRTPAHPQCTVRARPA